LTTEPLLPAWCPACEWNLDAYDPPEDIGRGWRWFSRFDHRTAFRLNAEQFAAYAERPPTRVGWTWTFTLLVAVSAVLLALDIAAVGFGVWLVLDEFPSVTTVPGVLLIAIGWLLRPRLGRFAEGWGTVGRADAPELFALLDRVAAATGAAVPDVVELDSDFNAAAGVVGLRRRRTLLLGLAMWGVLDPGQRVALLGHEMGHFVNGDSAHSLLSQPALSTFGQLADVVRPGDHSSGRVLEAIAAAVVRPFQWALARLFLFIQMGLRAVANQDHQRAEYCADAMAVRVAGTDAVVALHDDMAITATLYAAVRTAENGIQSMEATRRKHPGTGPWRHAAAKARAHFADRMPVLRQRTIRDDASLFNTHPPSGLRARRPESWPRQEPTVVLTDAESARIDAELAKWYARAGRDLAWRR
jgi:Zn-dependent protease with chaperone function